MEPVFSYGTVMGGLLSNKFLDTNAARQGRAPASSVGNGGDNGRLPGRCASIPLFSYLDVT
uniref:Uncharacterized protein n=1 Tax=Oryza nivara TaxID=4536 RepID=A0A0E0IID9_ORYNI